MRRALGRALTIAGEDSQTWLEYALASLERKPKEPDAQSQARLDALYASINAYERTTSEADRAGALTTLGTALAAMQTWKPAIKSYRASLALVEDPRLRVVYDKAVAEHGFHIASHEVDSDSESPRACIVFSDVLAGGEDAHLSDYINVDPSEGVSVEPEESQICLDGLKHGERYTVRVRAGLPSNDGETLTSTAEVSVFVRDRSPWVGFAGDAYVLPAGAGASIPISSINTDKAEAVVYRIGDRALASAIREGLFLNQLEQYRAGKEALFGYFVGQVMKATKGQANPKIVNERLSEKLRGPA